VSTSTANNLVTLPLPVSWTVHESNAILSLGAQNWLGKPTDITNSSSASYNAEEVTQDLSTETVMLSLLE
jgi:hypothetical protein